MANLYVQENTSYRLKSFNDQVEVDVEIGDGQPGSYAFLYNAQPRGANEKTNLGRASDIAGGKLTVSAMITDERLETNWTSIQIVITEGSSQTRLGPYSREVANQGDKVFYTVDLKLQAP